jgi:hypothetical protein
MRDHWSRRDKDTIQATDLEIQRRLELHHKPIDLHCLCSYIIDFARTVSTELRRQLLNMHAETRTSSKANEAVQASASRNRRQRELMTRVANVLRQAIDDYEFRPALACQHILERRDVERRESESTLAWP